MWKRVNNADPNTCLEVGWLFLLVVIIGLAMVACSPQVYGGWGTRGCGPVGSCVFVGVRQDALVQHAASLTWYYPADWENVGGAFLYQGNFLVGSYNYNTGLYSPADGTVAYRPAGDWPVWRAGEVAKDGCKCKKCDGKCSCGKGKCCGDKKCKCCCSEEEAAVAQLPIEQNFGLELDKINNSGSPRYTIHDDGGSRQVTKEQAQKVLTKGGLSDDSDKPFIVVCCQDPKQRMKIHEDLLAHPSFEWARGNVRVQVYGDPKHHHLAGYKLDQDERFRASGLMIAVMSPPNKEGFGKRLYAQYDYDGGPEKLSEEARRKVDPNWNPNPPPPTPAPPIPVPEVGIFVLIGQLFAALPSWTYVVASLGVAFLLWKRGAK